MIDAKLLVTPNNDEQFVVHGVWVPRRGDNVRLTVEVVDNQGVDLEVRVLHKNYEDVGDGTTTGVTASFNETAGRQTLELLGAKELIRFELLLQRAIDVKEGELGRLLLRFLEPVWFESVKL